MQVTLADSDGSFRALNLEYMPVRFIETTAGLLGLPAKEPAPYRLNHYSTGSLLAAAASGRSFAWLQRAGSADRTAPDNIFPDKWFWLRDKDTVGLFVSPPQPVRPRQPPQPFVPGRILPQFPGQ